MDEYITPRAAVRPVKSDPREFVASVKKYTLASTIAASGVIWGLVSSNVVGVTNRTADQAPAGTDPNTAAGTTPTRPDANGFFDGAGVQPPTFADGAGAAARPLPTVSGFGDLGSSNGLAGNAFGGGSSRGPLVRGGTS